MFRNGRLRPVPPKGLDSVPRVGPQGLTVMAHNTTVVADANAPPITRILAELVAKHPSARFPGNVEREAHRALMNWLGCAIGAARHPTLAAALAAMQELAPSPQSTVLGRARERTSLCALAVVNLSR